MMNRRIIDQSVSEVVSSLIQRSKVLTNCLALIIVISGIVGDIYGQVPSAIVNFEGHSGILIPRMSSEKIASITEPANGQLVYDSTLAQFFYFSNQTRSWRSIHLDEELPSTTSRSAENMQIPHQPSFQADWNVQGNIGADQYSSDPPLLGSTDAVPVVFITNDRERMRIMADGNIVIVKSLDVGENLIGKQNVDLNVEGGESQIHGPFTVANQSPSVLTGSLTAQQDVHLNSAGGETTNQGPFTVTSQSPSLLTGKLTVDGKTLLNDDFEVFGSTILHDMFKVDNNFSSLFTGPLTISDPSQSVTASTGSLVVIGGVGIGKNLNIGGNLDIAGASTFGGPVSFGSPVTISAGEESTSTSTGALVVSGGTGINKRLNVGGATKLESSLAAVGSSHLSSTLSVTGATALGSTLGIAGATMLANNLEVGEGTLLGSTLDVSGATTLSSTLGVIGAANLNSTLGVTGAANLNSTLAVIGATTLNSTLGVKGNFTVNSPNFAIVGTSGNTTIGGTLNVGGATLLTNALAVTGATNLADTLHVSGATMLNSSLSVAGPTTINNQLTIESNPGGGQSSFNAYPLKVRGGSQGIAIAVTGSRSKENNFISFFDGTKLWGRIEGQVEADLNSDPEYTFIKQELDAAVLTAIFQEVTASAFLLKDLKTAAAAYTSSTACVGFGACYTSPIPSLIVAHTAGVAARIADVIAAAIGINVGETIRDDFVAKAKQNIGVTYQSGFGDYAEWLPKANPEDKMVPGFIVGLKNGKVSLNTETADKILPISTNPIVLGNMPDARDPESYEKVAFLGQVPVHVAGKVSVGDYILPSGKNDGLGKAVHPSQMKPADYSQIVGVAWSNSFNDSGDPINVAIGLNDGVTSKLVSEQNEEIQRLKSEIELLEKQDMERNAVLAEVVPGYKEAAGISDHQLVATKKETNSKSQLTHIDEVIEINTPDPTTIVYYDVTREQVLQGIDLAQKSYVENGGNPDEHPFWKRMKSDIAYRDLIANEMVEKLQKTIHTHKTIDQEADQD